MTTKYPNREHQATNEAAHRRAVAALDGIEAEVARHRQRLAMDRPTDGDDTQTITSQVRDLTVHLSILGTLSAARAWAAADEAAKTEAEL